jgi:hypothetical protein
MSTHFLIVTQRLWLNETGDGVTYTCDGRRYVDRAAALIDGQFDLGHDDFNIATITHGRIVAFGWGMDDFPPDTDGAPHGGHDLDEIARQIGLPAAEVTA